MEHLSILGLHFLILARRFIKFVEHLHSFLSFFSDIFGYQGIALDNTIQINLLKTIQNAESVSLNV